MKIVLLESLGISSQTLESLSSSLIKDGHKFVAYDRSDDFDENCSRVSDADVVMIANMPLGAEVIKAASKLKMISVAFTGYDHVDMTSCSEKKVVVSNCAGYSTSSVAELALGLTLGVARKLTLCDKALREGKTKDGLIGFELVGKTVGVVGTGAIGSMVCRLFTALGCSVLAFSRTRRADLEEQGVRYCSLEELLGLSDVVTLHVPCNDETAGLVDRDHLCLMKSSAILINTARGPVVDNEALAELLSSGAIAGAGIDVFDMEPPLAPDYPLLSAPNCVLTPHVAFATPEALDKRAVIAFDNVTNWMADKPENVVS